MESTVNMMARPGMTESPPGRDDEVAALGDHDAPRGVRRRDARAEEAERRLQQDDVSHLERREDDDGVEDVREDVAEDDAQVRGPRDAGARDEVHLLERQHLRAHLPGVARPEQQRDDGDGRGRAGLEQDDEYEREQDERQREVDVDEPHDDVVPPAPEVARDEAEQRADDAADSQCSERDERCRSRAEDHTAEDVASLAVAAERVAPVAAVGPSRGQQTRAQVAVDGVVRRDELGEEGGDDEDDEEHGDGYDRIAAQERPDPSGGPGAGYTRDRGGGGRDCHVSPSLRRSGRAGLCRRRGCPR